MDMTPTHTSNTTNTASTKSPEPESETPTRIQPIKPISFTNGVLKRHTPHHHHHHQHQQVVQVSYKECLKNHAATLGCHALDGCGEFMPSPSATPSDPTSLKCAACGCHRNFHRREPDDSPPPPQPPHVIEYQPHHRHHPPPPQPPPLPPRSPSSASPPPISSSYYPASAHMLLALSSPADHPHAAPPHISSGATTPGSSGRKRFRTKFTQSQKDRMFEFAERVGWKMQKRDEELVHAFCAEVGVERSVLKVWMHNNKNTFGKKDTNSGFIRNTNLGIGVSNGHDNNGTNDNNNNAEDDNNNNNNNGNNNGNNNDDNNNFRGGFDANEDEHHGHRHQHRQTHYPNSDSGAQHHHVGTNGSSSS